ncbi:MAG: hypothetical protein PUD07_05855 [bacterium]|nr:hypothetical protein [bacterium]
MNNKKIKKIFKKIRLKTLFLLAITLASNSFAWFIYTTEVSSNITTKVREWKVTFDAQGQNIEKEIIINVDSLYPGMEEYTQTLTASNSGESRAKITYELKEATVLGDNLMNLNLENTSLIDYLKTAFPFKIDISASNNIIDIGGSESITIRVYWPYESGNDELDTQWGNRAYDYHEANPDSPSITLVLKISATQSNE